MKQQGWRRPAAAMGKQQGRKKKKKMEKARSAARQQVGKLYIIAACLALLVCGCCRCTTRPKRTYICTPAARSFLARQYVPVCSTSTYDALRLFLFSSENVRTYECNVFAYQSHTHQSTRTRTAWASWAWATGEHLGRNKPQSE